MIRALLRRAESGQAMVEFALVLVIVILLMVGILDFGRVVFAHNDSSHAARDAARQASVSPLDCETIFHVVQQQTLGQADVTATVTYRTMPSPLNQNPSWTSVCPAYDPTVTYDNDPTTGSLSTAATPTIGGEIRVRVDNSVAIATPILSNLVGSSLDVSGSSTMTVTFVPQ
jgi:Flp pilus assembly protein TadG